MKIRNQIIDVCNKIFQESLLTFLFRCDIIYTVKGEINVKQYNFCENSIKTRNLRDYTQALVLTANRAIIYKKPYAKEIYNSAKYLQKRLDKIQTV